MTTLPPLPIENEDPWFEKRQAFDLAIKDILEGRLSEEEVASLIGSRISRSILLAKGDLIVAEGEDMPGRLGIGTQGQTLEVDNVAPLGLKWSDRLTSTGSAVQQVINQVTELAISSIVSVIVEYAVNQSQETPPSEGWSTSTPERNPGDYIWSRTTITYGDETSETSAPVLVTGNAGASGPPGIGLESTEIRYQAHSSGTSTPTGEWLSSPPATSPGQYLWTRTVMTFTDSSTTTAYSVSFHGESGDPGDPGKGISSTEVRYQIGSSGTTTPTGTWLSDPPATTPGDFLWTRTVITFTDSTSTTTFSIAAHGATGTGISGTEIRYQVHSSGTTAPTGTWVANPPATSPGDFLWTRTVVTYTDSTTSTAYAVAAHGQDGEDGDTGPAGVGVASSEVRYQVHNNGTSAPTGTWVTTPPATTTGQFLWTRVVITYTNSTTTTSYSVSAHGATGAAGKGVSSTTITYQVHSNGTTAPTGTWHATPQTTTAGQFLWTRTRITYTDASTVDAYSVSAHGAAGSPGSNGVSVSSVTSYYLMVGAGSGTPAKPTNNPPGGSWSITEPAYAASTDLYRVELVVFSNATFTYSEVSKVSAYTASTQAVVAANLAKESAEGLIKASVTDPGHEIGRIWIVLDAGGNTIGIRQSNGSVWQSYALMADQVLVPSSLGPTSIANGAITTPKINTGAITADKIGSKEITADKLVVGSPANLLVDPTFATANAWQMPASASLSPTGGRSGGTCLTITADATNQNVYTANIQSGGNPSRREYMSRVVAGQSYRLSLWAKTSTASAALSVGILYGFVTETGTMSLVNTIAVAAPTPVANTWVELSAIVTAPETAAYISFAATCRSTYTSGIATFSDGAIRPMASSTLIENGAISANHLSAVLVLTTQLIAGNPSQRHVTVSGDGVLSLVPALAGEEPRVSFQLGSNGTNERIAFYNTTGNEVAMMDNDGNLSALAASFESLELQGLLTLGETSGFVPNVSGGALWSGWLDLLSRGLVAVGTVPAGASWNNMNGYVSQLAFTAYPGRTYMVIFCGVGGYVNPAASSSRGFYLGYATPAAPGGTVNGRPFTQLSRSYFTPYNTGVQPFPPIIKFLRCNQSGTSSGGELNAGDNILGLGVYASSATVSTHTAEVSWFAVIDMSLDNPISHTVVSAPGSSQPSAKTFSTRWYPSLNRSWLGNNTQRTNRPDLVQGYTSYSPSNGDCYSQMVFGGSSFWSTSQTEVGRTLTQVLSGATQITAKWYGWAKHWHYSAGGTAIIRRSTHTSLTATPQTSSTVTSSGWKAGTGRVVNLGAMASNVRSIWVGKSGGTNHEYYGYFGHKDESTTKYRPYLEVTYTRMTQ